MTTPAGAVLTGGRSRRMGTDKAVLDVGGVPMAARVAAALAGGGCDPVVLVGGEQRTLAQLGRPWHPDRWPGQGPLGGVLTALTVLERDTVVAACDLVALDAATVAQLVAAATTADPRADVVVARTTRAEPLLAVWRRSATTALGAHFAAGERAVHVALAHLAVVELPVDPARLRNANTPSELADALAQRLAGTDPGN